MTLNQLRSILKDLPGDLKVSIVMNGGSLGEDQVLRTITTDRTSLLLCDSNENISSTERVIYDSTPEPRMD